MNELDLVRLAERILLDDDTVLEKDTTGTIVQVLRSGGYIVEFVDKRGHTLGTAILDETKLMNGDA